MNSYSDDFERLWAALPKRKGGNPKPLAFKQFKARLKQGVDYDVLYAAAQRYKVFCDATGKTDTEWTQRASTWLGRDGEAWLEDWELPVKEVKETIEQKGKRLNMPARVGESMDEWQRRIAQAR